MLAFGPIASAPLGDDGGVREYQITANSGSFALTGINLTALSLRDNFIADDGGFNVTTFEATFAINAAPAETGTFALTGQDADFAKGFSLDARHTSLISTPESVNFHLQKTGGTGSFTLTGQSNGIAFTMDAANGSFAQAGQATFFGVTMVAGNAAYQLTGQAANTATNVKSGEGTFSTTGQDSNLLINRVITADAGSLTVTTQDNNFDVADNFVAAVGLFQYLTEDVAIRVNRYLLADSGAFTVTGSDNELIETNVLTAEGGTFTFTADDARLEPILTLPAGPGIFTLTGITAGVAQTLIVEGVQLYTITVQDAEIRAGRARRFEFADVANAATLSQDGPNNAILINANNEAA